MGLVLCFKKFGEFWDIYEIWELRLIKIKFLFVCNVDVFIGKVLCDLKKILKGLFLEYI